MDDPGRVRRADRVGDLHRDRDRALDRKRSQRGDLRVEIPSFQELEHEERHAVVGPTHVESLEDPRMAERRGGASLVLETAHDVAARRVLRVEDLHRNAPADEGVLRLVHAPHAAAAEASNDAISPREHAAHVRVPRRLELDERLARLRVHPGSPFLGRRVDARRSQGVRRRADRGHRGFGRAGRFGDAAPAVGATVEVEVDGGEPRRGDRAPHEVSHFAGIEAAHGRDERSSARRPRLWSARGPVLCLRMSRTGRVRFVAALAALSASAGCASDGPFCDAEAAQSALDAAAPGETVALGACEIAGPLVVPSGVTLAGRSGTTVLAAEGSVGVVLRAGEPATRVRELDVRADGRIGVLVLAGGGAVVEDVSVTATRGVALAVQDVGALSLSSVDSRWSGHSRQCGRHELAPRRAGGPAARRVSGRNGLRLHARRHRRGWTRLRRSG